MRRSAAVLVLGVAILAGACSSDDGGGSAANTSIPDPTTTASTTTEPRTVAPDIIPDDESQIDKAYAQGVVDEHALLAHEALKLTMAAGVVDDEVTALLQASRTETDAITASNDLFATAISGFEGLLPEPSPLTIEVLDVLVAANCRVFVLAGVTQLEASIKLPLEYPRVRFFSLRVSTNKYTGKRGTDTGNRLFGTLSC